MSNEQNENKESNEINNQMKYYQHIVASARTPTLKHTPNKPTINNNNNHNPCHPNKILKCKLVGETPYHALVHLLHRLEPNCSGENYYEKRIRKLESALKIERVVEKHLENPNSLVEDLESINANKVKQYCNDIGHLEKEYARLKVQNEEKLKQKEPIIQKIMEENGKIIDTIGSCPAVLFQDYDLDRIPQLNKNHFEPTQGCKPCHESAHENNDHHHGHGHENNNHHHHGHHNQNNCSTELQQENKPHCHNNQQQQQHHHQTKPHSDTASTTSSNEKEEGDDTESLFSFLSLSSLSSDDKSDHGCKNPTKLLTIRAPVSPSALPLTQETKQE